MSNELFTVEFWLTRAAVFAPVLVVLVVGLVICYRQRRRRPRAAKLIGWAMLAELIWLTLGWPVLYVTLKHFGITNFIHGNVDNEFDWVIHTVLTALPVETINAAIWGTALWAVLNVKDGAPDAATPSQDGRTEPANHLDGAGT